MHILSENSADCMGLGNANQPPDPPPPPPHKQCLPLNPCALELCVVYIEVVACCVGAPQGVALQLQNPHEIWMAVLLAYNLCVCHGFFPNTYIL